MKQMTLNDLIQEEPEQPKEQKDFSNIKEFAGYVGKCEFCDWGTDERTCQWSVKNESRYSYKHCENGSFWKPDALSIPKLCGSCKYANSFVYEGEDIYHPIEEPNIYCTREDGSVNRQRPFINFCQEGFGVGYWHRQHEWDTCDAWELNPFWGHKLVKGRLEECK